MTKSQKPISIIHDAVKVKRAYLMQIGNKYVLQHYDTIILEVENMEVTKITSISNSSNRAINQALSYLGFNKVGSDFVKEFVKAGKFVQTYCDGPRYEMGH